MTQEDKELLLKDLCARLPYDVKVCYENNTYYLNEISPACKDIMISALLQDENRQRCADFVLIEEIKPYLRPMSSMTEEEKKEYENIAHGIEVENGVRIPNVKQIDWLNKHHFDYRGLIEKGLALEALEGMYGKEE